MRIKDIYGKLLYKNHDDTARCYFITHSQKHDIIKWIFQFGWDKVSEKETTRNGLDGFILTFKRTVVE